MDRLREVLEDARLGLEAHDRLREESLRLSRECIRACREAIGVLHRGNREDYAARLLGASQLLARLREAVGGDILLWERGAGFDAQQEVAEAALAGAVIGNSALPTPDELGVVPLAWLHGLGDAVGELRREALERIRGGDAEGAAALFSAMEEAYDGLSSFDYPDAVSNNLRRRVDVARSLVERTHGEVVAALRQREMEQRLKGP